MLFYPYKFTLEAKSNPTWINSVAWSGNLQLAEIQAVHFSELF